MTDLPFRPLAGNGPVAAVRFGPKPRVKGDRRRGHAALRRSVSSLAIICALGAAALPGNAAAQVVQGVNGSNGTNGTRTVAGLGGAGAVTSGPNANSGGNGGDTIIRIGETILNKSSVKNADFR